MELDEWLQERTQAAEQELSFREIRKGVQAVSADYLGRLRGRSLGNRALDGRAKRAAFATFFSAIHHATVRTWLATEPLGSVRGVRRVLDLGCGTGAVGAAAALSIRDRPPILGIDRSQWAIEEARACYRAFGLSGSTKRATLPGGMPRIESGDLLVAGWSINELEEGSLTAMLETLNRALKKGAGLLIVEPISEKICPWWGAWRRKYQPLGVQEFRVKFPWNRPEWIQRMDKAAHMNHSILSARVLAMAPKIGD